MIGADLQGGEEGHQLAVGMPSRRGPRLGVRPVDGARLQGLGLHLQIDLGVSVGRLEGDVAEPRTNRVDVHSGTKEMHGGRMANGVRADLLVPQRRHFLGRFVDGAGDQGVNTVSCDRRSADVKEYTRDARTV